VTKISREQFDKYVEHYRTSVRKTAAREKWRASELAMALASAEETTRRVLRDKGISPPRRRSRRSA
jgi:hypothetical protein